MGKARRSISRSLRDGAAEEGGKLEQGTGRDCLSQGMVHVSPQGGLRMGDLRRFFRNQQPGDSWWPHKSYLGVVGGL